MNSSIDCKAMSIWEKRVKINRKLVCSPSFVSQQIFSKYFVAIHEIKPV